MKTATAKLPRRFLQPLALAFLLAIAAITRSEDLSGRVTDAKGQPLPAATVWIVAAQPRAGAAVRCDTCYEDVGRKAKTGPDGQFVFLEVDPWLVFRVAATADGCQAQLVSKADPLTGTPVSFALPALKANLPPDRCVRGRLVDADGKPVAGAVVESYGVKIGNTRFYGGLDRFGVDLVAVTNDDGEFLITAGQAIDAADLEVHAPRFAPKKFFLMASDVAEKDKQTALDVGTTISGRIVKDGQPVAGIVLGLSHTNRSSSEFQGDFKIATDAEGNFEFRNLPSSLFYYLYSTMESTKGNGNITTRTLRAGEIGAQRSLGDLPLVASHTIAGRIVVADGKKLPGELTILVRREWASDYCYVKSDTDGVFQIENLPHDESITIAPRLPGFRVVGELTRFQADRNGGIALNVDRARDDVVIAYEIDRGEQ